MENLNTLIINNFMEKDKKTWITPDLDMIEIQGGQQLGNESRYGSSGSGTFLYS